MLGSIHRRGPFVATAALAWALAVACGGTGGSNKGAGGVGGSSGGTGASGGTAGSGGSSGGGVTVVECQTLTPAASGVCQETSAGTGGVRLQGNVLAPRRVLRGGEVVVDASGTITCVDCDCSGAPGAADAAVVTCAQGVISPGLINTHDHIPFNNNGPVGHGTERFEHRHDWRDGLRGHTEIPYNTQASDDEMLAHELRFVMSGTTSVVSDRGPNGLLRNLDWSSAKEGIDVETVDSETFPHDDISGILKSSGCDYGSDPDTAADVANKHAYVTHLAEGVDDEARNELVCATMPGPRDIVEPQTAVVHAMALHADDAAVLRESRAIVSWSPRTNVDLYGNTAPVRLLHTSGVPIALGTDWIISGSMNLLRELRCVDELNSTYFDGYFSDFQIWQMVTTNATLAVGTEHGLGLLKPGYVADIAIFDGRERADHRAVVGAAVEDVVLVLRGGRPLYGDADLVASAAVGGGSCETLDVCGVPKRACVADDVGGGTTLASLTAAAEAHYPLFFCDTPMNEPSCVPFREGEYDGVVSDGDSDGDGIANGSDLCPTVFDPVRPMDGSSQSDRDADGLGDACDPCPTSADNGCTPPDADDLDEDGVPAGIDNCPEDANSDQADADDDGKGDACDPCAAPNPGLQRCALTVLAVRDPSHPDHPAEDSEVTVTDLWVTGVTPDSGNRRGFYAQDDSLEPLTGIFVFTGSQSPGVAVGNRVLVTGTYTEFFEHTQIQFPTITVLDAGTTLPFGPIAVADPADIATGGSLAESYESMLVEVTGVTVTVMNPDAPADDFDEFVVTGGLRIDDTLHPTLDNTFAVGTPFARIAGPMTYSFDNRKLLPRSDADLQ